MTVFTFLLFASPAPFLIASPLPTTRWMTTDANNTGYTRWASETGDRLQIASVSFLVIGSIAILLVTCLILFEERWVGNIVPKFPKHTKQEADLMKKVMETNACSANLECKGSDFDRI